VLIFNRNSRSTRRICNLDDVIAALDARGLTHTYADVPPSACDQFAALSAPRKFVITPHGAHEVNLFATWPNASVIEVMPHRTDIPIYNRLVSRPVWVISERLRTPFKCTHGVCEVLPAHYGACTRVRGALMSFVALSDIRIRRTPCVASSRGTGRASSRI